MTRIKSRVALEYIDHSCGFPVALRNVAMHWIQGDWVADIDYALLEKRVAQALACKAERLTGAEVKFLRLYLELTYQKFADLFAVAPQAVMKWEKTGQKPTKMAWTTEKDLRLTMLDRLGVEQEQFVKAFRFLRREREVEGNPAPFTIDLKRGKSPRAVLSGLLKMQAGPA